MESPLSLSLPPPKQQRSPGRGGRGTPGRALSLSLSLPRLRRGVCPATGDAPGAPFRIGGKFPPRPIAALPRAPPRRAGQKVRCESGRRRSRFWLRIEMRSRPGARLSRLLLVPLLVLLLAAVGRCGSSRSLRYFYTALSEPGQGLPQFIAVGYVDDQPIVKYDSHTRKTLPAVPWMEKAGKEDLQYWERETQNFQGAEPVFRVNLETLRRRFHQENNTGLHVVQVMYGCEVGPDGRLLRGYRQYAYDGEDFLALDRQTRTWTAPVPQAQETKRRWEKETHEGERASAYLEETCVEWLRRYLGYGAETLLRAEAPTARVTRKEVADGRETLVCRAHGFYPKEIVVTWRKGEEVRNQETLTGGVVPNSDGTYHTWLSIKVDPQERNHYRCHVEHDGLPEPLDLAWEEPASHLGLILAILGVLAALLLVGAGVACCMRKRKEKDYKATPGSDQGSYTSNKNCIPA